MLEQSLQKFNTEILPGKGSWTETDHPGAPEGVTGLADAFPLAFLIFFLFKEERYFECLITKLELRLNYSPDMQQQSLVTLALFYNSSDGAVPLWGWGKGGMGCLMSAGVCWRHGGQCHSWHFSSPGCRAR